MATRLGPQGVLSAPPPSQLHAAHPGRSSWVSASAGTGKTKILTDRVLSLLLSGARPHKILCLTFTKAGATEMTQRLMARLERWATMGEVFLYKEVASLHEPTPEILARARRLFTQILDAPQGLTIQTLHSFCQSLLQRFPVEAGIPWAFSIADEATAKALLTKAQEEILCDPTMAPFTAPLVTTFGQAYFHELVESLFASFQADRQPLTHAPDLTLTKLLKVSPYEEDKALLLRHLSPDTIRALAHAHITPLSCGGKEDQTRSAALDTYLSLEAPKVSDFMALTKVFLTAQGEVRARLATKAVCEKNPQILSDLTTLAQHMMHAVHLLRARKASEISHAFFRFFVAVMVRFQELKDASFLLDYDDLIDKACALLHDGEVSDWVRFRMDGGLDHILVDEAQDTNARQWALVEALSQEFFSGLGTREAPATLFAVGDVKQSIYRFQGAMPHLFEQMRASFAMRAKEADLAWQDIGMNVSYRSSAAILETVDRVFETSAAQGVRTLEGSPLPHIPHRQDAPGFVEMWPLEARKEEDADLDEEDGASEGTRPDKRLAEKLAQHIGNLLTHPPIMASTGEPLAPRDILILVQRRCPFVRYLTRALKTRGIPVAGEDRLTLSHHLGVQDMMSLGRFMLLPQDDWNLACLLKSPLVGLDEDTLFQLCAARAGTLWQELVKRQDETPALAKAHTFLGDFLRRADLAPPLELFTHALYDAGRMSAFRARFGAGVEEVLQEFLALVQKQTQRHGPSLERLMARLMEEDVILKRDFAAGQSNETRIMTVHGSKGLQAPFVILPDTITSPSLKENFVWQDGVCVWLAPQDQDTPALKSLKARPLALAQEDANRLLYVALTRPQDRLLVCGWESARALQETSWYARLSEVLEITPAPQDLTQDTPFLQRSLERDAPLAAPSWLNVPLTREYDPFASAQEKTPSSPEAIYDEEARLFGEALHHLLEYLPKYPAPDRAGVARVYLQGTLLSEKSQTCAVETVLGLLDAPHLQFLFGQNARHEVDVAGLVDGAFVRGRLDLLVVEEERVMIVDFKSGRRPGEGVPQTYLDQLQAYRTLMAPLYPTKPLTTWILWTQTAHLEEV